MLRFTVKGGSMTEYPHLYRDKKNLVFRKGAMMPSQCIKTNKQLNDQDGVQKKIYWNHPLIGLTLFISPLIYIILALATRKQYEGFFPVCPEYNKKRKFHVFYGVLALIVGIVLFIVSAANEELILLMAPATILVLGAIIFLFRKRLLIPIKITNDFVWMKGVHKDFLHTLPQWHPSYEYGAPEAAIFD